MGEVAGWESRRAQPGGNGRAVAQHCRDEAWLCGCCDRLLALIARSDGKLRWKYNKAVVWLSGHFTAEVLCSRCSTLNRRVFQAAPADGHP